MGNIDHIKFCIFVRQYYSAVAMLTNCYLSRRKKKETKIWFFERGFY